MGSYVPNTKEQRQEMLKEIGFQTIDDLFAHIPAEVKIQGGLNIPEGKTELEVRRDMENIAAKNQIFKTIFRGAGAYRHFIPATVKSVISKENLLTAYTPYQAEISQGILQSIFEYQTMICDLTGMDISNACVYDGAEASAEGVAMCRDRKRSKALVSATVNPYVLETIKTYCFGNEMEVEEVKELLKEKKYNELKEKLKEMKSADISMILDELDDKESVVKVFRILSKEKAGVTFSYMESDMREKLIQDLTDTELKNVLDELFMDDTVDLIEEMPSNVVTRILKSVSKEDRKIINELLKYPEDSAGSIMTTEFIDLKENMTVEQALDRIRKQGIDSETIYTCYVLDEKRILLGIINIKDILLANKDTQIHDLMETSIISVTTTEDQEEVAKKFDKYDFYALPVVDNEKRLVGIITVDDAISVLQDEVSEDFELMAAMKPNEDNYFETSVFKHAKNRIVWLLVLMLSAIFTGVIITKYEDAFAVVPLLVAFIPMIMDTGGNCGSQSSTLIIRGLATDEIELKDVFRVLWKEIRVAIIVGLVLSLVNGFRIFIQYKDLKMSITIGLTLIGTVILAKCLGCLLPLLAKKLKLDPAIMAAPIITTLVDTCSMLIYFQIATVVMGI